jgi:hypothetical protein
VIKFKKSEQGGREEQGQVGACRNLVLPYQIKSGRCLQEVGASLTAKSGWCLQGVGASLSVGVD